MVPAITSTSRLNNRDCFTGLSTQVFDPDACFGISAVSIWFPREVSITRRVEAMKGSLLMHWASMRPSISGICMSRMASSYGSVVEALRIISMACLPLAAESLRIFQARV